MVVEPTAVLTVMTQIQVMILFFQDAVGSEAMSQAIDESGLGSLVYTHTEGQKFPTLGELIEQNTRVIIASESHGPPPPWYHYGWDLFFDTPYSFKGVEEFSCSLNRGQPGNPLFLLNHWLADSVGLPSKEAAETANAFDILETNHAACLPWFNVRIAVLLGPLHLISQLQIQLIWLFPLRLLRARVPVKCAPVCVLMCRPCIARRLLCRGGRIMQCSQDGSCFSCLAHHL